MKEKQHKSCSLRPIKKMRDVNVTQHYCQKKMCDKMCGYPPTTYASELPSGNNFRHLHSVYKYVDGFLSNTAITKRPAPAGGSNGVVNTEFSQNRFCKKIENPYRSVRYTDQDHSAHQTCCCNNNPTNCCSHRVNYQAMGNHKQDNIQNNVRSANMRAHVYTARTPSPCVHRRPNYVATAKVEPKKPTVATDYYVEQLKNEINQSRAQICQLVTTKSCVTSTTALNAPVCDLKTEANEEYVRKLKEELVCRKYKCITEARNIITELQNEITGYRLKTKSQYSSSCSDIGAGDQPPTSSVLLNPLKSVEFTGSKKHVDENHQLTRLSCCPQGELRRWNGCETLWQSKKSSLPCHQTKHASSQDINFEAKLEEAHGLIEKVRATLRDLGKGISKSDPQKVPADGQVNASCQCLYAVSTVPIDYAFNQSKTKKEAELKDDKVQETDKKSTTLKKDIKPPASRSNYKEIKKDDKVQEGDKKHADLKKDVKPRGSYVNCKGLKKDDKVQESDKKNTDLKKLDNVESQQKVVKPMDKYEEKTAAEDKNVLPKSSDEGERKIELVSKPEQADIAGARKSTAYVDANKEDAKEISDEQIEETNEPLEIITIQPVKEIPSSDDLAIDVADISTSMDLLQEKLKSISEEDFAVQVNRMERGSSPIDPEVSNEAQRDQSIKPLVHKNEEYKNSIYPGACYTNYCKNSSLVEQQPEAADISVTDDATLRSSDSVLRDKVASMLASKTNKSSTSQHEKIKSTRGSTERVSRISSEKSAKSPRLSIQLMPPVSIRGGLVIQKTLHLSINPTGSVTNAVDGNEMNVGYKEIKMVSQTDATLKEIKMVSQADSTLKEIKMVSQTDSTFFKCPGDCKNTDGDYCKSVTKLRNVFKDIEAAHLNTSGRKSFIPITLDEDALNLFRSFQIFDDPYQSPVSAENEDGKHNHATGVTASGRSPTSGKNPWAMGFYKSIATQCSETLLLDQSQSKMEQVIGATSASESSVENIPARIERSIHDNIIAELKMKNSSRKDVTAIEKPGPPTSSSEDEVQQVLFDVKVIRASVLQPQDTPDNSEAEREMVYATLSAESSSIDAVTSRSETRPQSGKSNTTGHTSPKSSLEESVKDTSKLFADTNKDVQSTSSRSDDSVMKAKDISMVEILSVLRSNPNGATTGDSTEAVTGESQLRETSGSELDKMSSKPSVHGRDDDKKKDEVHDFSSSSSGSSYNIHGSITSPPAKISNAPTPASVPNSRHSSISGIKRSYEPVEMKMVRRSLLKSSTHDEAKILPRVSLSSEVPDNEDHNSEGHKKKGPKKPDKVEVEHEVSKEVKAGTSNAQKVDESVQASFESSESESSAETEHSNTIAYFIKGLTGTSHEQLEKLRSTPSFPKNELQSLSKHALQLSLEKRISVNAKASVSQKINREESRIPSMDAEQFVDTLDYVKPPTPDTGSDDDLSEGTKMKRFKEFQKMNDSVQQGDKKEDDKIIMRMKAAKMKMLEGEHSQILSKRQLPFYRRVLGRIIEPNSKRAMPKSLSDANPVEESISEGEIKCKGTRSIGEINSYKYIDRKKIGNAGVKYLKKHLEDVNRKEMGDQCVRIARQRAQYNNWVNYYLQKQHNFSLIDDSSSSSPSSRSKR